jgi:hypothetical protein
MVSLGELLRFSNVQWVNDGLVVVDRRVVVVITPLYSFSFFGEFML